MNKKFLISILCVMILPVVAAASGTAGAEYLKIKLGGRALAIGGAYAAIGDDIESLSYNPAGLTFIKQKQFHYSHMLYLDGITVSHISYGQVLDTSFIEGNVGVSLTFNWDTLIDNEDAVDDPVSFQSFVLSGTYANKLSYFFPSEIADMINIGLTVKVINETIGYNQGSTFGFDAGLQFVPPGNGFSAGVSIINLGMPIRLIRGIVEDGDPSLTEAPLPLTLRIGAGYKLVIDKDNTTRVAFDYIQDFADYPQFAAGLEHSLSGLIHFRLGYNTFADTRSPAYASAGVGITVSQFEVAIALSYAYRLMIWGTTNAPEQDHTGSIIFKF